MGYDAEKERLKQIAHSAGYHQYEEDETTPWPTSELSEQEAADKKKKKKADDKKADDDGDDDDEDKEEDETGDDDDAAKKKKAPPFPPKKKKAEAQLREVRKVDMYALYIGDGALVGAVSADTSGDPTSPRYWPMAMRENDDWVIAELDNVPADLAAQLEAQGTSDQTFRDGYDAANAAARYAGAVVDYGENADPAMIESKPAGKSQVVIEKLRALVETPRKLTEMPTDPDATIKMAQGSIKAGKAVLETGSAALEEARSPNHRDNNGDYAEYDVKLRKLTTPDWVNDLLDDKHGEWAWDMVNFQLQHELETFGEDLKAHYKIVNYDGTPIYQAGRSGGWLLVPMQLSYFEGVLGDLDNAVYGVEQALTELTGLKKADFEDEIDYADARMDMAEVVADTLGYVDDLVPSAQSWIDDLDKLDDAIKEVVPAVEKYLSSEEFWSEEVAARYDEKLPQMVFSAVEDGRLKLDDLPKQLRSSIAQRGYTM